MSLPSDKKSELSDAGGREKGAIAAHWSEQATPCTVSTVWCDVWEKAERQGQGHDRRLPGG